MLSPISQRIADAQNHIVKLRDQLEEHLVGIVDDTNVSDDEMAITTELNGKIERTEKSLATLQQAEQRLAQTSQPAGNNIVVQQQNGPVSMPRPFAVPAQKIQPADHVWRSLVVKLKTHLDQSKRSSYEILKDTYGEDDITKAVFDVINKTATIPADTVTSGWASQLVQTSIGEFFAALIPNSVYPALAAKGGSFTFGRNGALSLPTRSATPTIAGAFVAQGAPIPVRQGAFTAIPLTPKKMGVISTFTREISEHSTPAIEALIRQAITEDTSVAIDTILLDATAADTTRPAGLRNGVTESANSTLTTLDGMIADFKVLATALITGTNGNIRNPVWIMNPTCALNIVTKTTTTGDTPYRAEIAAGTLFGWPIIQSTNIPFDRVIAMDAADFMTATGDTPNFSVSDQAVLHMEDTTPLAIGTAATPNTVAAPVRSLWQTDCIGIRMLLDINWAMRRTGVISWSETFAWD
jgi:hypothetical protein